MTSAHTHVRAHPGESAPFHFESTWRLDHPITVVWPALLAVDDWPRWWPGVSAVVTEASGIRSALRVRGQFGIRLSFDLELVDLVEGATVAFSARGDLRGSGELRVLDPGPPTRLAITWCVVTRRRPLRLLRPIARAAHDRVMRAGNAGLDDWLSRPEAG